VEKRGGATEVTGICPGGVRNRSDAAWSRLVPGAHYVFDQPELDMVETRSRVLPSLELIGVVSKTILKPVDF